MKTKLVFGMVLLMHVRLFASGELEDDFVAHEWGTFTSVQGADGVQMEWNPLVTTELPKFVYDQKQMPGAALLLLSKSGMVARQRLETPVIYFYSAQEREVSAKVL